MVFMDVDSWHGGIGRGNCKYRQGLVRAMVVPDRRTLIVLIVLVSAMTLASGLLLGLEPGPRHFAGPLSLSAFKTSDQLRQDVLNTSPPVEPGRWNAIAIHFSGSSYGSARTLNQWHEQQGLGGLAYHMVIGDGLGSGDGQVEFSLRWQHQLRGLSSTSANGRNAIDICLIGDGSRHAPTEAQMQQLVRLVRILQEVCNIPAEQVYLYTDAVTGRGRMFPVARFRQQLLSYQHG